MDKKTGTESASQPRHQPPAERVVFLMVYFKDEPPAALTASNWMSLPAEVRERVTFLHFISA